MRGKREAKQKKEPSTFKKTAAYVGEMLLIFLAIGSNVKNISDLIKKTDKLDKDFHSY